MSAPLITCPGSSTMGHNVWLAPQTYPHASKGKMIHLGCWQIWIQSWHFFCRSHHNCAYRVYSLHKVREFKNAHCRKLNLSPAELFSLTNKIILEMERKQRDFACMSSDNQGSDPAQADGIHIPRQPQLIMQVKSDLFHERIPSFVSYNISFIVWLYFIVYLFLIAWFYDHLLNQPVSSL